MNASDIAQIRLQQQQIATPYFRSAADLLRWMGAMQAQDYPMLKQAIAYGAFMGQNVRVVHPG